MILYSSKGRNLNPEGKSLLRDLLLSMEPLLEEVQGKPTITMGKDEAIEKIETIIKAYSNLRNYLFPELRNN